jgi:hypothetical protein
VSYATERRWAGTGAAAALSPTAGRKGHTPGGGKPGGGRRAHSRRKKRAPGRGHDDKDRLASIAWGRRPGAGVSQATRDDPVKTGQKAAARAGPAGRRLETDSARSSRAVPGSVHAFVHPTQPESARGDVHAQRAAWLCSLLQPYVRRLRGRRTTDLPG